MFWGVQPVRSGAPEATEPVLLMDPPAFIDHAAERRVQMSLP